MATTEATISATARIPGPGNRGRRRENDDLYIFSLTNINTDVTFTPFGAVAANGTAGVNKGFPKSIYDWALKPVSALSSATLASGSAATTDYSQISYNQVNTGAGAEMTVTYTPPTSTAAGFFTFTCTAGSGLAELYVWAK